MGVTDNWEFPGKLCDSGDFVQNAEKRHVMQDFSAILGVIRRVYVGFNDRGWYAKSNNNIRKAIRWNNSKAREGRICDLRLILLSAQRRYRHKIGVAYLSD